MLIIWSEDSLAQYSPLLLIYTPWKHHKTFRFRRVTRGGRGEASPALFRKLEKIVVIWRKNAQILVIYGYNFSFKMKFQTKKPEIFPCGAFLSRVVGKNVYRSSLIRRKLPCPKKFLVMRLRFSDVFRGYW